MQLFPHCQFDILVVYSKASVLDYGYFAGYPSHIEVFLLEVIIFVKYSSNLFNTFKEGQRFSPFFPYLKGDVMNKYQLKLFITGHTLYSWRAITNLRRICEEELGAEYELTIIDIQEQPQVAEDKKILATPTLIKESPPPVRRIIGDLSDTKQVLMGLELPHQESREEK
jgi:circadian clock protein KaiB